MSALKPNSKTGEYMWIFQKDEVLSTTGRYLMWVADFFFFPGVWQQQVGNILVLKARVGDYEELTGG